MHIHEAIQLRTAEAPYITREAWYYPPGAWYRSKIKLLPTNTPDCCILESASMEIPRRGWQPTAEDLCANDWIILDD